jgi:hypothetical protein
MNRSWFVPGTLQIKATSINLVTDPSGSLSSNGNPLNGTATTSGSTVAAAPIALNPGTATISAMTCRGVSGPGSTTPVPWTMAVTGKSVIIQFAQFSITSIGGSGTPTSIYLGPIIPASLMPSVGTTVNQSVYLQNGGVNAIGVFLLNTSTGQISLGSPIGAALTANCGLPSDARFEWQITAN